MPQNIDLYFNDSASQNNKDLTDFLERNIKPIITRGGFQFNFVIATTQDLQKLRRKGIKRLPALVDFHGRKIIGVPKIVEFLRTNVKNSKSSVPEKSDEEFLRDYQLNMINKDFSVDPMTGHATDHGDDDYGDGDSKNPAFLQDVFKEAERRNHINHSNDPFARGRRQDRRHDPPPSNPDRRREVDRDFGFMTPPAIEQGHHRMPPRNDNIGGDDAGNSGDPIAALNNISGRGGGNQKDDLMMAALLERIGE